MWKYFEICSLDYLFFTLKCLRSLSFSLKSRIAVVSNDIFTALNVSFFTSMQSRKTCLLQEVFSVYPPFAMHVILDEWSIKYDVKN